MLWPSRDAIMFCNWFFFINFFAIRVLSSKTTHAMCDSNYERSWNRLIESTIFISMCRPIVTGQAKSGKNPVENWEWMRNMHSHIETRTRVRKLRKLEKWHLVEMSGMRCYENATSIEGQTAEKQVAHKWGLWKRDSSGTIYAISMWYWLQDSINYFHVSPPSSRASGNV